MAALYHNLVTQTLRDYDIVYNGYFANHMLHDLVSLHHLGASDERLQQYFDTNTKFNGYGHLDPARPKESVNDDSWKNFLGKKENFHGLLEFFTAQVDNHGTQDTLRKYLPVFVDGLPSAAFHCMIQLGFGIMEGSNAAVSSGLAYLCHSYTQFNHVPIEEVVPKQDRLQAKSIFESLQGDDSLVAKGDRFKARLEYLLDSGIEVKRISQKGFEWKGLGHLDVSQMSTEEVKDEFMKVNMDLQLASLLLFHSGTGSKGFFALHGVTSAFSLTHIIQYLLSKSDEAVDEESFQLCNQIIRKYWSGLLTLYVACGQPDVQDVKEVTQAASVSLPDSQDSLVDSWAKLIERTIEHNDEHVCKLVYACKFASDYYTKQQQQKKKCSEDDSSFQRSCLCLLSATTLVDAIHTVSDYDYTC